MKKYKFGIVILLFLLVINLFPIEKAYAEHKLESLHIHVFIKNDGSARIIEKRNATLSEGTENYIVIGNLGKSKIKDFVVKENGETFQFVYDWDIDASQSEKTFKNGMIKTKDGYELSWGIGEYGKHEYIVEYTITNFIKQLQDSQILFWRFVNDQTNIPPEEVTVEIETEMDLSEDTEKTWGFGFSGNVEFRDGKVVATSSQPLTKNDYVTILVKFSDGMFTTDDYINQPFEEIKEKAFEGSDYGKEDSSGEKPLNKKWFFLLIILLIFYDKFISLFKKRKKVKKFKRKFRGEYYRDFPYDGPFLDTYYLLYKMGATNFEKLLTSFILKWINDERIMVESERVGFIRKKYVATIYFLDKEMEKDHPEGELFHMMLGAANSNDVLEQKEFAKWAGSSRRRLERWETRVFNQSLNKLKRLGYIRLERKGRFLLKRKTYELTKEGQELEEKVYKYVNYLHDFSLLIEHEAINVKIWDEIMIWAAFLGLTDVVRKQFNKLYPKYEQETIYSSGTLHSTNSFSQSVSDAQTQSRSSGSGGSTSSSGGGGSFGGGSGGGTR